jgi:hypothetical protein
MKYGIFFRNTSYQVDKEILLKSDFLIGEIAILEELLHQGKVNPCKYIPAISAFLGAKKLSVKKEEIRVALEFGVEKILYFFDSKNVKFGYFQKFQEEINELMLVKNNSLLIIYLPIDNFLNTELEIILQFLSRFPVNIMTFTEDKENMVEKIELVTPKIFQFFKPPRVQYLFKSKYEMMKFSPLAEQLGIQDISYFEG